MTSFFGLPTERLAQALAVVLAAGLLLLVGLALRHPVLCKLGLRNIGRRKTQTALIATGLMLSTMLLTTALGVGDIITGTVQAVAVASLGRVDEIARDPNGQASFPLARFDQVAGALRTSPAIAGAMPVAVLRGQLLADMHSRQIATVDVLGVPAHIPPVFGPLHGPGRTLVNPATLGPDDVLVNPKLAEALAPAPGDLLYLFHDGTRSTLHVRALVNAPGITGIKPTAIMALPAVASLKGWPGRAGAIVVANRGTASNSAGQTDAAMGALQTLLPDFAVDPIKRAGEDTFAHAQDIFTRVLVLFTLFAAGISLLLILLVYTLLVAERRAEMGVARALGTARGHLVQTFLFEGAVYDLVAAALGVGAGLAIGSAMTTLATGALTALGVTMAGQVQPRSLALAYGLGALCTGLTVTIASWWVSNLNIVAAMRGLPGERRHSGMREALRRAWRALSLAGRALLRLRPVLAGRALLGDLPRAGLLLAWRLVVGGLPLLLPGLCLLQGGLAAMDPALFAAGATGSILGGMLALRAVLRLVRVPPRLADRLAITPGGLALLGFWALPIAQFDAWGWPRFTDGVEVFFVAGVMMVGGGVLVAVYNVDLLLRPFMAALALAGRAATARVALAYPLHHKGRSGLALSMFALVSFTLTVMAVIIAATLHSYGDLGAAGNGFDLQATTAFGAVPDVDRALGGLPYLPRGTLAVAGSTALSPVGVIQLEAPRPRWSLYALNRASDGFLSGTSLHLAPRAAGYDSDAAVWRALRTQPNLAVIDSAAVLSAQGYPAAPPPALPAAYANAPLFVLSGVHAEDRTMAPTPVWIADPTEGRAVRLTIIGVVDRRAFNTFGIITAARNVAGAGFPRVPPTFYYFKAAPGVDPHVAAHRVEAAYLPHGMQAIVIAEELDDGLGPEQALSYMLEGFMSLTLLMGVVALGLIAGRAVVERRHSVGTMRALGYTRRMVGLAFLAEALFTAALGLAIGGALGLILSKNLFDANFLQQGMALAPPALGTFVPYSPLLTFAIPWPVLVIIDASALLATLLATILPAWQASRIPPAHALRYE